MNQDLLSILDLFNRILHTYTVIDKKPKNFGNGDLLFVSEVHTIYLVGKNPEINVTNLAELLGITKGAISQTVSRLARKDYLLKYKVRNHKEVNLKLTEKGQQIYLRYMQFIDRQFVFAEELYNNATKNEIDLVKRLFVDIYENMNQINKKE
jgi:DNA-binding MarR family transcriptional regulator